MIILGDYTNDLGHELEEDFDNLNGSTVFQCRLCRATGVYSDDWLGGIAPEILSENCPSKLTNLTLTCS